MLTFLALLAVVPDVEPARVAAGRLGAALGRPIEVARPLAAIPVLVDAPSLAPEATLKALAFVLHASVVRDGRGFRVERTAADRKAVDDAHLAANRVRVADGLAHWDRILARADRLGDAAAGVRAARAEVALVGRDHEAAATAHRPYAVPPDLMGEAMVSPVARLLHGLLERLGPHRLAALAPGETRFLSDRPNAAEAALPPCADLVAAYAAAQEGYAAAMGLPVPSANPAKLVLKLNEGFVRLDLYDARGRRLEQSAMSYAVEVFHRGAPEPPADLAPRWIERDDASRRLANFLVTTDERSADGIPADYLRPERRDPLDFDVRTGLLALPRPPGAPALVAALDDGLIPLAAESVRGARLDAAALAWRALGAGGFDRLDRLDRDGVTVLRPKDALAAEARLADREALGRETRRVVATREFDIQSRLRLCAALYTGGSAGLSDAGYVAPLRWIFGFVPDDPPAGAMALGGTTVAAGVSEVDADAPPFAGLVRDGIVRGWLRFEGPPGASDLDRSPSTVLAALAGARLVCATLTTPVVHRYGKGGGADGVKVGFGGEEPEALGEEAIRMFASAPKSFMTDQRLQRFTQDALDTDVRYILGRRETLAVEVRLRSGLRARLEFSRQIADRRDLAFSELPSEMQAAILRGARAMFDNLPPATRGNTPPTPPTAGKP